MNQEVSCTIKFNNYLQIMAKNKSSIKINNYDDLVKELKNWDVSPQETWDLVFNMKLGIDKRTIWKLQRYYHYAIKRLFVFTDISKQNDNNPKIKQLKGEQHFAEIKKLMPKRVDTIKELVSSDFYQLFFKFNNKKRKFDSRLEVKNLEKLLADKREDKYFTAQYMDLIAESESRWSQKKGKSMLNEEGNLKEEFSFDRPGFRTLLRYLR